MTETIDEQFMYHHWSEVLLPRMDEITSLADQGEHTLLIDFKDITDMDLQASILETPGLAIPEAEKTINTMLPPDIKHYYNVRIVNLWKHCRKRIRDIRAELMSKFISMEVEIKRVTEVRPKLVDGAFSCSSCGFMQSIEQDAFHFTEPLECTKDDGGCGKKAGSTTFKFHPHDSLWLDSQKIMVQELREDLRGTQQPQTFEVYLEDDLCGMLDGGEVIIINGVVKAKQKNKQTTFDTYFQANSIETDNVDGYDIEYTQEEIDDIISKMGSDRMKVLTDSFAPAIKGMQRIKQAMVYQQVGGTKKTVSGGKRRRGDIFIGLIGDPGTAKSSLGEFACSLQPGSVIVDGDNPTVPGLTATATKDEFSEGRYVLEPGALVLCHNKLFMWDEMHLANPAKIGALHRPMENMEFSVAKGGIVADYKVEFGGIFIANPLHGRFMAQDEGRPLIECIDTKRFTEPLRDRICIWAKIKDDLGPKKKKELVKHVLADDRGEIEPPLSKEELMKYFAYCRTFNPIIPHELDEDLSQKYVDASVTSQIYNRHLFTIIRLAEANAKIFNREEVTSTDIDLAYNIVVESLRVATADVDGKINLDAIHTGMGKNQKMRSEAILDIIRELSEQNDWRGAGELDIESVCITRQITDWEDILNKLWDRGAIMKTNKNLWKVL